MLFRKLIESQAHNEELLNLLKESEGRRLQYKDTLDQAEIHLREMVLRDDEQTQRIEQLEAAVAAGEEILQQVDEVKRQLAQQAEAQAQLQAAQQAMNDEDEDNDGDGPSSAALQGKVRDLAAKLAQMTQKYEALEAEREDALRALSSAEAMSDALERERGAMNQHRELLEKQAALADEAHQAETVALRRELAAARSRAETSKEGTAAAAPGAESSPTVARLQELLAQQEEEFNAERDLWRQSRAQFQ